MVKVMVEFGTHVGQVLLEPTGGDVPVELEPAAGEHLACMGGYQVGVFAGVPLSKLSGHIRLDWSAGQA